MGKSSSRENEIGSRATPRTHLRVALQRLDDLIILQRFFYASTEMFGHTKDIIQGPDSYNSLLYMVLDSGRYISWYLSMLSMWLLT